MRLTITRARDTAQLYLDPHDTVTWRVTRVVPSGLALDPQIRRLAGCVVSTEDLLAWAVGTITSDTLATGGSASVHEEGARAPALERSA